MTSGPTSPEWWNWELIHAVHMHRPWIVIVEPDVDAKLLVVVTPYEVSE